MVDVFISYSRDNQREVRLIADKCKALGYAVWWDDQLPPHKSYGDVITEKIGLAKAVIVVWSKNAAASEWVRAEADVARNQKKLVQTALDDTRPPLPFNQIQFVMLDDWTGEDDHFGWSKVKDSLAELCGPPDENAVGTEPGYAMPNSPRPEPVPEPEPEPEFLATKPPERPNRLPLIAALLAAAVAISWALFLWLPGEGEDGHGEDAPVAQQAAEEEFPLDAVIADADGFTYIRNAPARGAAVIGSVPRGEVFSTREQVADWWEVMRADGTRGYMHESRIRVLAEGEAPPEDSSLQTSAENAAEAQAEALDDITAAMQGVSDAIEAGGNSER